MRFGGKEVAHRRIDMFVGSAHVVAAVFQHRGERGHRGTGDADEMNARHYWTAASRMRTTGDGAVVTSAFTPKGNVQVGPLV